jgi:hypothetical protein
MVRHLTKQLLSQSFNDGNPGKKTEVKPSLATHKTRFPIPWFSLSGRIESELRVHLTCDLLNAIVSDEVGVELLGTGLAKGHA